MCDPMYDLPEVFQAAVWMDDGNEPIAAGGWSRDFVSAADATQWAIERAHEAQRSEPAPSGAPGWYGIVARGHYDRTGTTGFDEIDCEWVEDEPVAGPLLATARTGS